MRNRNHCVSVWLNDTEYRHLQNQAEKAGLKLDPFIRLLITGIDIQAKPPDEWAEAVRLLSNIASNINQIARMANSKRTVSLSQIQRLQDMQEKIWEKVKNI